MKRFLLVAAIIGAGALALAGCSGASGEAGGPPPAAQETVLAGSDRPLGAPIAAATDASTGAVAVAGDGNLITAQATGQVSGTPDVVTVTLGVETRDASAQAALDSNNALAAEVIATIKANGVADEDLQTSRLSISPTFDDTSTITGYQVSNMVTAKLRDVGKAGALIDAVGASAGDAIRVQRISFSIDDDSVLRAAARADAVHRAQAQAQQMADAAGVRLGLLHAITETPQTSGPYYAATEMAAAAPDASVPVEVGSVDLSVVVQVVYEIAQ